MGNMALRRLMVFREEILNVKTSELPLFFMVSMLLLQVERLLSGREKSLIL